MYTAAVRDRLTNVFAYHKSKNILERNIKTLNLVINQDVERRLKQKKIINVYIV